MTLRFDCPGCGKALKADTATAGGKARCSGCGGTVVVPRWQGAPAELWVPPQTAAGGRRGKTRKHAPILPPAASGHEEDLIDMTAMVDIVFFLLIFFLVTSLQALEAVMDLPSAQAQAGAASKVQSAADLDNDPEFVSIRIEDDDSVWVEEEQVFGAQELRVRLRRAKDESEEAKGAVIKGNADASHGAAVMVFDACMSVGLEDIRLSVTEQGEGSAE